MENQQLKQMAAKIRLMGMDMVFRAASGHIGGSLSCADILAFLYGEQMRYDPQDPRAPGRDRFVLSKGHCTPALYPALVLSGFFPEDRLTGFRSIETHLSGHAEMRHVPGVDMSTGSLGQGVSAAVGMALAGKLDGGTFRVYTLLGDGELQEGQVWEAAMSAAKYRLDNLCAIVDLNGLQIDGPTAQVMPLEPLSEKFAAFGWHVLSCDGHDFDALRCAFRQADTKDGTPTVILAHTVKGKGVSFMENEAGWHGKAPGRELYEKARGELLAHLAALEEV